MHAVVVLLYRISLCVGTAVLHGSNYRVSIQDVRRRRSQPGAPSNCPATRRGYMTLPSLFVGRRRLALFLGVAAMVPLPAQSDAEADWLIAIPPGSVSSVALTATGTLLLSNGLTSREFALTPAFGTVDWTLNATTAHGGLQSMFRAVMPEGQVTLDNTTFDIGGLAQARTFRAYCNRSEFELTNETANPAFRYVSHTVGSPLAPFPWVPGTRYSPPEYKWPPAGKNLAVVFAAPQHTAYRDYKLTMHYEIYDGLPLISKWFTLEVEPGWATYPPPPPTQITSPSLARNSTIGGWRATAGAELSVSAGKLDLSLMQPPPKTGGIGAAHLTPASSTGLTLAPPGPGQGELQTSLGLGLEASGVGREEWEVMASCDAGGLYIAAAPQRRLQRVCACKVGDTVAVAHDKATKVSLDLRVRVQLIRHANMHD